MDEKNRNFSSKERYLNLLEVKPIPNAQKNKINFSANDLLLRRKSGRLVKKAARALGLRVKINNVDDLEFYGDICQDGKCCYSIYKYWHSQAFHMQHEIKISRCGGDFKERFYKVHKICADSSIIILFPPVKSWLELEVVLRMTIYEHGFNENVLDWVISEFDKCSDKISPLFK